MKHRQPQRRNLRATTLLSVTLATSASLVLAPASAHALDYINHVDDPVPGNPVPGDPGGGGGGTGGGGNPVPGESGNPAPAPAPAPDPEPAPAAPVYSPPVGPGTIPDPPMTNGWDSEPAPQTFYPTVYNPAPQGPITAPRPTPPLKMIAPKPGTIRVGNFTTATPEWLAASDARSVNRWAAWTEVQIAQGLISTGAVKEEDEARRQAAATVIGVMLGGTAGAIAFGVPAALLGGAVGAVVGTAVGAGVGSVIPPQPLNTGTGALIGLAAGTAGGAALLGIPAAALGAIIFGTAGGALAHALGAGDPGATPEAPVAPLPNDPDFEPAVPNPGANQYELKFDNADLKLPGGPEASYTVTSGGDVEGSLAVAGLPPLEFELSEEQALAPFDAFGPLASTAYNTIQDATIDLGKQATDAIDGLSIDFPQMVPPADGLAPLTVIDPNLGDENTPAPAAA